jgi:hypothetical protein
LQRHSRVMKRTIVNEKFSNNNYTPLSVSYVKRFSYSSKY